MERSSSLTVFGVLCLIGSLVDPVGLISFSDNSCEIPGDGGSIQYRACLSDPLAILGPNVALYTLSVTPSNITCGSGGRQLSCTLGIYQTCSYCDNSDPTLIHPQTYMVDYDSTINSVNLATYWQSVTWAQMHGVPQANITISLGRTYQMWDDLVITFKSIRPQQMLLEKSTDNGATWQTIQYFNKSCKALWDSGVAMTYSTDAPDTVICSQDFSSEYPSVDGQVSFGVYDRFKLFLGSNSLDYTTLYTAFSTTNLMAFLTFTDLRIRLLYPATDGKEDFGDLKDLVRYYYAISDIRVVAGCWCNLHAKYCSIKGTRMACVCKHNTDGDLCERCLPLFNNRPWSAGNYLPYPVGTPNECQACTCYNHADSCTYDPTLGYGRCDLCKHNTTGFHCDQCLPGFFQDNTKNLSDINICATCSCQVLGISNNDLTCLSSNGQCNCKPLVMGRQCDVCFDQFYGLLQNAGTCLSCVCNTVGTVGGSNICDKQTGQCPCKPNIFSRDCSLCRDGFYEFPAFFTSQDCLECQCDPGGSLNLICLKQGGQCTCRPNIVGRRCSLSADNYYVPLIDANNIKPQPSTCLASTDLVRPDKPFTLRTFVLCNQGGSTSFDLLSKIRQPKILGSYIPVLRYGLNGTLPWTSLTLTIRPGGLNFSVNLAKYSSDPLAASPPTCSQILPITFTLQNLTAGYGNAWMPVNATSFQLDVRCVYTTTLSADSPGGAVQPLLIDALTLVPDYRRSIVYANETNQNLRDQYDSCVRRYVPLQTRDMTKTESICRQFMFSVMAEQSEGALPCDCDPSGTVPGTMCDPVGGQCQCQPGVAGRRCEYCQQGYYGFSAFGCTLCNCDVNGSSNPVCDYVTGQCPCRPSVALFGNLTTANQPSDFQCHFCLANYYGITSGQGCKPCSCSQLGAVSSQCDETGACQCYPTIGGNKCDACLSGYFGFSAIGCKLCNCSIDGALNVTCDNITGNCYCKPNVQGSKCDTCKIGTFNIAVLNPDGCQTCFCFAHSSQCTSATGFSELIISDDSSTWKSALDKITYISASSKFLGDMHYSYGQWLSYNVHTRPGIVINISNMSQPVILEGNGTRVAFRPVNLSATDAVSLITVPLHQSFWYYVNDTRPLDAKAFISILGSLSRILIQQRFDYDFINVSIVSMRSAAISADGSSQVTYVENCTCNSAHSVAGLSCGNCSQGFQRPSATSTLFSSCVACNCSSRAATSPPMCDEWSGVCLNCGNGSLGLHCENCAPYVEGVLCDLCRNRYWSISKTGCIDCQCYSRYTMMNSPVCNKFLGNCSCDPTYNVGGLRCDQCKDNYVNVSGTCQPCNECYGLVVDQMKILRANQTNLAALVGQILGQDRSATLGPFYVRLINAQNNITALNAFSSNALALEQTLPASLQTLKDALQQLMVTITTSIGPTMNTINQNMQTARDSLSAAVGAINSTQTTLIQAYNQLHNEMPVFTQQLQDLMASLMTVLNSISGNSDAIINGIQQLNLTVLAIEANANSALTSSQTAFTAMQAAKSLIDQMTTQLLPTLDQSVRSANLTGQQININAQATMNSAMILFQNASTLRDLMASFSLSPFDTATALARIQQELVTASQLSNSTVAAQSSNQPTFNQVQASNTLTIQLINQVNANKSAVDALNNRFTAANQTAANAVNLSQNATDQAQRMVNIMTSFDASAQAVQDKANNSLQTVQSIRALSQQATNFSDQLLRSLQISIANSNQAQQMASQSVDKVNQFNQALVPVSDKANLLLTQSSLVLNDYQAKATDVLQKNISIVTTLANSLNDYLTTAKALEDKAQLARMTADNVTLQVQLMQNQIAALNQRIQAIQGLDGNAINQLQSDVQQAQIYYNGLGLLNTVVGLNQTITDQRVWITNMKTRRDDLQQQIARLQTLLAQLRPN